MGRDAIGAAAARDNVINRLQLEAAELRADRERLVKAAQEAEIEAVTCGEAERADSWVRVYVVRGKRSARGSGGHELPGAARDEP